jgi:hypothetical protein
VRAQAQREARPALILLATLTLVLASIAVAGTALAQDACEDETAQVDGFQFTVDGGATWYDDLGDIPAGDLQGAAALRVDFTLDSECLPVEVTLASYEAAGPTWETSVPQDEFDNHTDSFVAAGTLEIGVPDCFYQVDFVHGPHIAAETINANHPSPTYADLKIDWRNGGEGPCEEELPAPAAPTPTSSPAGAVTPSPAGAVAPSGASPSPGERVAGGVGGPRAGQLPDTAASPPSGSLGWLAALIIHSVACLLWLRLATDPYRRR